uniref:Putative Farnesyltranstransferase n=1 Tax=mine drainage metagenome TaxID=410659 RepID=E6PXD2_9ZZZZ
MVLDSEAHAIFSNLDTVTLKKRLQRAFSSQLPIRSDTETHLASALRETLHRPGSMVRAELAYRVGVGYGVAAERAEQMAIAIEYFHTASLLFDDLPAMDNAHQRRGLPCVHRSYGEGAAMLAALALINRAYGLLWRSVSELPGKVQGELLAYFELHLGLEGLLNGQSEDLHYARLDANRQSAHRVALGKTVSLIRLSLVMPALLGRASQRETQLLDRLAIVWGLAYQALDDLKDVLHAPGSAAKTAARDAHLGRPNIALAIGIPEAFVRVEQLMHYGDCTIASLIRKRESLIFLRGVRQQFEHEIDRLSPSQLARAV